MFKKLKSLFSSDTASEEKLQQPEADVREPVPAETAEPERVAQEAPAEPAEPVAEVAEPVQESPAEPAEQVADAAPVQESAKGRSQLGLILIWQ